MAVGFLADLLPISDPAERHFVAAAIALVIYASRQAWLRAWLEEIVEPGLRWKPAQLRNKLRQGIIGGRAFRKVYG